MIELPNEARGPTPQQSQPARHELKLIFKDSPLFTPARRERITQQMEDFRNYLVELGFDAPVDLPPLDVSPGTTIGEEIISGPGVRPYQSGTMVLSEKMIDDPMSIAATYSRTAFRKLFENKFPRTVQDFYFSYCSFWFANYFTWSYSNRTWSNPPARGTVDAALWDIRTRCSKPFTDRAMFYAFMEMKDERDSSVEPLPKELTLTKAQTDAYFLRHFLGGENIVDSRA